MLRADAVVDTAQPGFEIGEHEMNDGQKGFRDFHVAALRDGGMKVSAFPERRIAAPIVGNNGCARRHGAKWHIRKLKLLYFIQPLFFN